MKIADSSIDLFSNHLQVERHVQRESLAVWGSATNSSNVMQQGSDDDSLKQNPGSTVKKDIVSLSQLATRSKTRTAKVTPVPEEQKHVTDLNLQILRKMIERITGKVLEVRIPGEQNSVQVDNAANREAGDVETPGGEGQEPGMEYTYYESHSEQESTSFQGNGTIVTEDGKEIDFDVQLNMSREFMSENTITVQVGEPLKDPLVINFSGNAAEITTRKFFFDIDADGIEDQIGFTGDGSGFLAVDLNENDRVDDGFELFGPRTGNGFSELASYDSDHNQWIDENDAIYSKLRIWMKNDKGEDQLFALGEKGVGAIYLNHIETPFLLKDADNNTLGKIRDTGVVLNEDGTVGTIQQIDIAV